MPNGQPDIIERALDALHQLMRMFQIERIFYLAAAVVAFGLLVYAVLLIVTTDEVAAEELGLIFGATGIMAVTGGRIAFFLNRAFNLIEYLIRNIDRAGTP